MSKTPENRRFVLLPGVAGTPGQLLQDPQTAMHAIDAAVGVYSELYSVVAPQESQEVLLAPIENQATEIINGLGKGLRPSEE